MLALTFSLNSIGYVVIMIKMGSQISRCFEFENVPLSLTFIISCLSVFPINSPC